MNPIRLGEILRPFEGKWVALNREKTEVLSSGEDPQKVLELAKQRSTERPILQLVPLFDMDFVG